MTYKSTLGVSLAAALLLAGGIATAQMRNEHAPGAQRPPAPHGEEHAGPRGYTRPAEPQGWNKRPATFDRGAYQHNFHAPRSFRIGPYHPPGGWVPTHWAFGQILPRAYWAPEYHIADYWLFGLELPPAGYEWVRDDDDAILVNVDNGEILQVEYGIFA